MSGENWFQQLPQNFEIGLQQGSIYATIALGYTLVYGVLQLINFAHSEVFMSGAFGSYLVVQALIGDGHVASAAVPFVILAGAVSGAITGAAIAWLLEKVAYKPLRVRGAPKLAFLISAIGASLFLSNLAGKLFNRLKTNAFPTYFNNRVLFTVGGRIDVDLTGWTHLFHTRINFMFPDARVRLLDAIVIGTTVIMMVFLDLLVNKTKLGRGIRGVAEDAPTAALMGIDIDKTISRTFIIGGALAGVAGFLYGTLFGVGNLMGFQPGVKAFAAAVLGGIGNIRGAMIGGLLLGEAEILVSSLPFIGSQWNDVVSFVVLVLILLFRPTGILGERLGRAA